MNKKLNLPEYSIKFKELGKPIFKAKGKKETIKKEIYNFLKEKF
jgi:hypothetical protein